jgi:phage shock protein PspC (stress-responsive transcriptional regulator)
MSHDIVQHNPYELRRVRDTAKVGGVLGGLARHLGIDATLLRVGYLLVSFLSAAFPGLLVYLMLWIIIPADPEFDPLDDHDLYEYDEEYEDMTDEYSAEY